MPNTVAEREPNVVPPPLAIATGGMLLIALYMIFVWAPMESTMGVLQRIFYFHMPSAIVAFVAFITGGIASIRYVSKHEDRFDDLSVACNEVGLLFAVVNLVTGMIWGRPAWGVFWAWDARLTTMLLLVLIYIGYLILRQSVDEPNQRAVVCAVVSIFGMADIPIVYVANRVWRTQHPAPVIGGGGGGLDANMWLVLLVTFVALLLLMWCLVRSRRRLERLQREADGLRREVHAL
jgi:heme exporter protein C